MIRLTKWKTSLDFTPSLPLAWHILNYYFFFSFYDDDDDQWITAHTSFLSLTLSPMQLPHPIQNFFIFFFFFRKSKPVKSNKKDRWKSEGNKKNFFSHSLELRLISKFLWWANSLNNFVSIFLRAMRIISVFISCKLDLDDLSLCNNWNEVWWPRSPFEKQLWQRGNEQSQSCLSQTSRIVRPIKWWWSLCGERV